MKTLFAIVAILLLAAAGFVAYVYFTLDPEELGRRVLTMINEKTGIELSAETLEVRPLEGVRLEGASFQGDLPAGAVTGTLDRMILDYDFVPILRGEIVMRQIAVEGPELSVVTRPVERAVEDEVVAERVEDAPDDETTEDMAESSQTIFSEPEVAPDQGFLTAVSITEIRVTDGGLQVRSEGSKAAGMTVQGFNLELEDLALDGTAPTAILGFAARGGIEIDEIRLDEMTIEGGRGTVVVDRGHLRVTDFGVETANAGLQVAELGVDLTQEPSPYRLQAGGSYDVDRLVEAEGEGFGPAAIELSASGTGPDIDDMVATGTFRLEDGQVPAFPMMVRIEKLIGKSLIVGHPYQGADIVFSIEDGIATIEPFVMGFENLQMAGGGTIDLAGPIDIQIDIRVPRDSVSNNILDPFIEGMTDEDGWTSIPFNIGGSMADPSVDFDMTSIKGTAKDLGKRAVSRALDEAVVGLKERTLRRRAKDDG